LALPPGTRLGPYEIATPIGAGGTGKVYRARDTRDGQRFLVNTIVGGDSPITVLFNWRPEVKQ
jgi:hypothetical protein